MSASYIPSRDGDLSIWVTNFDVVIAANPGVYGLVAGDAVTIHSYVAAFNTALALAVNPSTKTQTTVAAKDGAKAAMLDIIRQYAQQIKSNFGVSNALKEALGLTINDTTKTPVVAPTTQPLITIVGALPLQISLRYADSASPDRRGKPSGALGMQLFVFLGPTPPTDPLEYRFSGFITTQPVAVDFNGADIGKKATFIARWQTRTGLVGPWSSPVSMSVAG